MDVRGSTWPPTVFISNSRQRSVKLEILQESARVRLETSAVKRQFVDILGGLAAVTQTAERGARRASFTFSRRRRQLDASSSSPDSKRLSIDEHVLSAATETKTAMRRSCAAAVLACSARTKPPPPSNSEQVAGFDHPGDFHGRPRSRPTRRPTASARRRLSENKENISDNEHHQYSKLHDSFGVCRPDIRYPRLFPDLNKVVEEDEQSSLVRTSSGVCEDLQRQTTSTSMSLDDVSAISQTSDAEGGVLHRVRSTTSVSSLNGAFCSSSGDEATTTAGAFCSTFSYPLHSTVIDSFFDVSALLPPRPQPSADVANDHLAVDRSSSQRRQLDSDADGSSQNSCRRTGEIYSRPRLFDSVEGPNLLDDVSNSCQLADVADNDRRRRSMTVEQLSPSSPTELDFVRTGDANCTARLRRQMGQTRLYTTNSSSSQRQSDYTCSRLQDVDDCSRSTLFECGCSAEQQFHRLPAVPAVDSSVLPTSTNYSLSRSRRRYAEQFESPACFTDTCRSWSSNRRRMTMHCPPTTQSDAMSMVDRPTDLAVRRDRHPLIDNDQRQSACRQLRSFPHRRAVDERLDRRQRVAASSRDHGCPLCGCGRSGEAAGQKWSKTSKSTSSNCDSVAAAAERRRKRELLRKLRRFSDAFYGNTGELQLKTFGHF